MRYFIDTEFSEKPNTIDLISIGIAAEDGRLYYAVSKDFNLKEVWNNEWLRQNVLISIYKDLWKNLPENDKKRFIDFTRRSVKRLLDRYGKPNKQIAAEIIEFVNPRENDYKYGIGLDRVIYSITRADAWNETYYPKEFEYIKKHNTFIPDGIYSSGPDGNGVERNKQLIYNQPEFWGYYADYDWVVFCWLFGRMIYLPKGFPMYCRDLKQKMDDLGLKKEWKQSVCPDSEDEHNAIIDAAWNKRFFECLCKYQIFK